MAGDGFDPAVSPLRVFGAMLRYYRTRAGLSQTDLGTRVHFSGDLVSKVEMGQRMATEEFTAACEAVPDLDTGGALAELRGLMREALKNRVLPGWFADWPRREAQAKILRWFEMIVVPGLLQTEDYARALLADRIGSGTDDIDEKVAARMERQAILDRDRPPELWVVIDEAVLHRRVGGAHVMREQLSPRDAPRVAYQDTAVRGQIIEDADDIAVLMSAWDRLRAETLSRSASMELMEEVAKSWT